MVLFRSDQGGPNPVLEGPIQGVPVLLVRPPLWAGPAGKEWCGTVGTHSL